MSIALRLSQMLHGDASRLPRAETVAAMARVAGVSADWLLGLSQQGQITADVVNMTVEIAPGAAQPADEHLRRWHKEAIRLQDSIRAGNVAGPVEKRKL